MKVFKLNHSCKQKSLQLPTNKNIYISSELGIEEFKDSPHFKYYLHGNIYCEKDLLDKDNRLIFVLPNCSDVKNNDLVDLRYNEKNLFIELKQSEYNKKDELFNL